VNHYFTCGVVICGNDFHTNLCSPSFYSLFVSEYGTETIQYKDRSVSKIIEENSNVFSLIQMQ